MSAGTENTSITFRCLARRPACLDKSWRERGERTKTQTPRQSTAPPVWAAIEEGRKSREEVLIMTIYTKAQGENWRPCGKLFVLWPLLFCRVCNHLRYRKHLRGICSEGLFFCVRVLSFFLGRLSERVDCEPRQLQMEKPAAPLLRTFTK